MTKQLHEVTKNYALMRKFLLIFLLSTLSFTGFSQFKIGFQASPILSTNRVEYDGDDANISSDGSGIRIAIGPIVDIELTEHYYVSTGILFASKRAGIEGSVPGSGFPPVREEYNLQYVQIPATLKLFTNEVALDKRIYFQFGGQFEFNVKEEPAKEEYSAIEDFRLFDLGIMAGLGMEYKLGVNTIIFGGLSYHRGLINAISEVPAGSNGDLSLKNDYIGLNFGVKF